MEIVCTNCLLRPWQEGDETSLVYHANNRKIWDHLRDLFPHPYTQEDAYQWLDLQEGQDPTLNFAIVVGGEAVGGVGLMPGKGVARISAEIGYWLGESFWGKGIITEAVKAIVDYGLTHLAYQRIFAEVFAFNTGSIRVLEKVGFEREGVFRQAIIKNGKVHDAHCFGIYAAS